MVGEQQVTTIVTESLQRIDNFWSRQTWQILPTLGQSHTVAHDPAGGIFLNVQLVNSSRRYQCTSLFGNIVLLEPGHSIFLVSRSCSIVVGNEHGQQAALARLIGDKETDGLSFRQGAIGKARLDGIDNVHICWSLLDEIAGGSTFQFNDVGIVPNDLDSHDVTCRICPAECHLTTALWNVSSDATDDTF